VSEKVEIEIVSDKTLRNFPDLVGELRRAVTLSGVPINGLTVRILAGELLQPEYDWIIWKLDPRGMRLGRCIGRYRPPGMIEIDVALGRWKPRLQTIVHYLFHELGHHKAFCEKQDIAEKDAECFSRQMLKRWRELRESRARQEIPK